MRQTESFVGVPATLNALHHKDYRHEYLEVYIAIRSLISLSPEKENFCFSFPGIDAIARKYRLTPQTVRSSIAWLQSNSYLYTLARGKRPNTYTIVIQRELFLRTRQDQGLERAIEENEAWMEDQREKARDKSKSEFPGSGASRSSSPKDVDLDQEQP